MSCEGKNPDEPDQRRLLLLKNERPPKRQRPLEPQPGPAPVLRLIDCRPNLYDALRRVRWRTTPREVAERALGRISAFLAAKLRR